MEVNETRKAGVQQPKRSNVVKVLHWGDNPPSVVCLVGPTKHASDITTAFRALTLAGHIVMMPSTYGPTVAGFIDGDTKKNIEELQFRKIEMSDMVFVVSPNGYSDASMKKEIEYAESLGKQIKYLTA